MSQGYAGILSGIQMVASVPPYIFARSEQDDDWIPSLVPGVSSSNESVTAVVTLSAQENHAGTLEKTQLLYRSVPDSLTRSLHQFAAECSRLNRRLVDSGHTTRSNEGKMWRYGRQVKAASGLRSRQRAGLNSLRTRRKKYRMLYPVATPMRLQRRNFLFLQNVDRTVRMCDRQRRAFE